MVSQPRSHGNAYTAQPEGQRERDLKSLLAILSATTDKTLTLERRRAGEYVVLDEGKRIYLTGDATRSYKTLVKMLQFAVLASFDGKHNAERSAKLVAHRKRLGVE